MCARVRMRERESVDARVSVREVSTRDRMRVQGLVSVCIRPTVRLWWVRGVRRRLRYDSPRAVLHRVIGGSNQLDKHRAADSSAGDSDCQHAATQHNLHAMP